MKNTMKMLQMGAIAVLAIAMLLTTGLYAFAETNAKNVPADIKVNSVYEETVDGYDSGEYLDYSNLTEAEQKELESIYDRYAEIWTAIFGENLDATEEEIEARCSEYETEMSELATRAAELEEKADWVTDEDWDEDFLDYSNLTEDEQRELESAYERFGEIWASIFDEAIDTTKELIETRYSEHEAELTELTTKVAELEEKAGWEIDEDWDDFDEDWFDYSTLTKDEQDELQAVYDRFGEIWEVIFGEDLDATDAEIEERYSEYESELGDLATKAAELEEKAGWVTDEDWVDSDEDWSDYSMLTEEEQKELESIYDRYGEIWEIIFGEDFEATDAEVDARYAEHEAELNDLEAKAAKLEDRAYYGDLNENEISELNTIFERLGDILETVYGDDRNLSEDEVESRFKVYESEWDELMDKVVILEEKAWKNR